MKLLLTGSSLSDSLPPLLVTQLFAPLFKDNDVVEIFPTQFFPNSADFDIESIDGCSSIQLRLPCDVFRDVDPCDDTCAGSIGNVCLKQFM